ncbi:MAG TPA: amidohydrolase [Bacteroidetes bacterium]|nr:amidohydrolase [Bacteroidota bacterium]
MNRRKFVSGSLLSSAGLVTASGLLSFVAGKSNNISSGGQQVHNTDQAAFDFDLMKEVRKFRKIDAHIHVHLFDGPPEGNIDFADRLGIEKMVISRPAYEGVGTPGEFRKYNNQVLDAMKAYPDRFLGQFTLNPVFQKESLEEIARCVDLGMVGLKVYTQVKINDPLFYPVIEKMIDHKMIIHMHAHTQLGVGGYRMKYDTKIRPNTSIPEDFTDIAQRYPEAMFQYAHIGGGGDWEYACKSFVDYPNIYVDTSGSNNPEYMVDFAVQQLGEDRVFFGTDNCYYQSVGKILAANLSESQKKKVFFHNYNNILKKAGNHVD